MTNRNSIDDGTRNTIKGRCLRWRQELPTVAHGKSGSVHGCNHNWCTAGCFDSGASALRGTVSKRNSNHTNYPYAVHSQHRDDAVRVVKRLELLPRDVHSQPSYVGLGRQEEIGWIYEIIEGKRQSEVSSKQMTFDVTTTFSCHATIKHHITHK